MNTISNWVLPKNQYCSYMSKQYFSKNENSSSATGIIIPLKDLDNRYIADCAKNESDWNQIMSSLEAHYEKKKVKEASNEKKKLTSTDFQNQTIGFNTPETSPKVAKNVLITVKKTDRVENALYSVFQSLFNKLEKSTFSSKENVELCTKVLKESKPELFESFWEIFCRDISSAYLKRLKLLKKTEKKTLLGQGSLKLNSKEKNELPSSKFDDKEFGLSDWYSILESFLTLPPSSENHKKSPELDSIIEVTGKKQPKVAGNQFAESMEDWLRILEFDLLELRKEISLNNSVSMSDTEYSNQLKWLSTILQKTDKTMMLMLLCSKQPAAITNAIAIINLFATNEWTTDVEVLKKNIINGLWDSLLSLIPKNIPEATIEKAKKEIGEKFLTPENMINQMKSTYGVLGSYSEWVSQVLVYLEESSGTGLNLIQTGSSFSSKIQLINENLKKEYLQLSNRIEKLRNSEFGQETFKCNEYFFEKLMELFASFREKNQIWMEVKFFLACQIAYAKLALVKSNIMETMEVMRQSQIIKSEQENQYLQKYKSMLNFIIQNVMNEIDFHALEKHFTEFVKVLLSSFGDQYSLITSLILETNKLLNNKDYRPTQAKKIFLDCFCSGFGNEEVEKKLSTLIKHNNEVLYSFINSKKWDEDSKQIDIILVAQMAYINNQYPEGMKLRKKPFNILFFLLKKLEGNTLKIKDWPLGKKNHLTLILSEGIACGLLDADIFFNKFDFKDYEMYLFILNNKFEFFVNEKLLLEEYKTYITLLPKTNKFIHQLTTYSIDEEDGQTARTIHNISIKFWTKNLVEELKPNVIDYILLQNYSEKKNNFDSEETWQIFSKYMSLVDNLPATLENYHLKLRVSANLGKNYLTFCALMQRNGYKKIINKITADLKSFEAKIQIIEETIALLPKTFKLTVTSSTSLKKPIEVNPSTQSHFHFNKALKNVKESFSCLDLIATSLLKDEEKSGVHDLYDSTSKQKNALKIQQIDKLLREILELPV